MILLPNYSGLVNVMKQAGSKAVDAGGPVHVCFGKVTNVLPLRVSIDQKMILGQAQLVLTRNVTDYKITITDDLNEDKKVTIHNSLHVGDEVVLLRQQGGQKYIIMDRVG